MRTSGIVDTITEEGCNERVIQTAREGGGIRVVGGHGITGHDFTGRWLGECHAIGWQSYVLHVSCTAS